MYLVVSNFYLLFLFLFHTIFSFCSSFNHAFFFLFSRCTYFLIFFLPFFVFFFCFFFHFISWFSLNLTFFFYIIFVSCSFFILFFILRILVSFLVFFQISNLFFHIFIPFRSLLHFPLLSFFLTRSSSICDTRYSIANQQFSNPRATLITINPIYLSLFDYQKFYTHYHITRRILLKTLSTNLFSPKLSEFIIFQYIWNSF